jgi:hypothetical protein
MLLRILRQLPHRRQIRRVRARLPLQRAHGLPRILARLLLVAKHGVNHRRPSVRRREVRVQPLCEVQLDQLGAHLRADPFAAGARHERLDLVLERLDLADAVVRRAGLVRRQGALAAGAGETPFLQLGEAVVARVFAEDVADGELLARLDVADGDGGVGDVADAVVDAGGMLEGLS